MQFKNSRLKWILLPVAFTGIVWAAASGGLFSEQPDLAKTDFREELTKLAAAQNITQVYSVGHVKLFDGGDMEKIMEEKKIEMIREGRHVWSRFDVMETILFDSLVMEINHVEKNVTIRVMEPEEAELVWDRQFLVDDWLKEDADFKVTGDVSGLTGDRRRLTVQNEFQPEVWKTVVDYDTVRYSVVKTQTYWIKDEKKLVENEKAVTEKDCWVSEILFRYSSKGDEPVARKFFRIVKYENGEWKLTNEFSSYELTVAINQI